MAPRIKRCTLEGSQGTDCVEDYPEHHWSCEEFKKYGSYDKCPHRASRIIHETFADRKALCFKPPNTREQMDKNWLLMQKHLFGLIRRYKVRPADVAAHTGDTQPWVTAQMIRRICSQKGYHAPRWVLAAEMFQGISTFIRTIEYLASLNGWTGEDNTEEIYEEFKRYF